MLLTVLSALARLGIDPWQEAAQLAVLPEKTATQRLVSLIAALPDGPSAHRDPGTIAARLIALLPCRAGSNHPLRKTRFGADAMPNSRPVTYTVFIAMIFIALVLGIVARRQPAAPVDDAQATASGRVIPQMPPSSGQ